MKVFRSVKSEFIVISLQNTYESGKIRFVILIMTIILGAVASIWPSMVLKQIVDGLLTSGDGHVWGLAGVYLLAVLAIGLVDFAREMSASIIGQEMILSIRKQMLHKLPQMPMKYYIKTPIGDTISRFTADLDAIHTLFSAGLVTSIADLFKILGLFLALFLLSPELCLVAFISLPWVFFVSNYFRKHIFQKQIQVRKRVSDLNISIQEIYAGARIIKVFGKADYFSDKFEDRLESHRLAMNENSVYDAWFPCVMQVIRSLIIATALTIGSSANIGLFSLGLSIGTLAAVADIYVRMFEPIEAVASEIQTIQQAFAGVDRMHSFFLEPVEDKKQSQVSEIRNYDANANIEINNVTFEYVEGKKVLKDVSIEIKAGTKVAIAGRTGSGKSTLMALISGLYTPNTGRIRIGGLDPFEISEEMRRRVLGIAPQTVQVFNGTIMENITLRDDSISREAVMHAVELVGLADVVDALADGLDSIVGEGESNLSYGQIQLLSLARAIVMNPPLLLLDELTSGLDALTEKLVLSAIKKVSLNRTIITISHRLSGIIDADEVLILEAGKLVESGTPESLTQKEGWYSIYKRLEHLGWNTD